VPADEAEIGITDRIFSRVGASDNLAMGESTFLVEMSEAANILNNTTNRSFIIMDEIGRGTSTYDGLSIAWAIIEYLLENPDKAGKTLFATHYHELTQLGQNKGIKNYNVSVKEWRDTIVFLKKVIPGAADKSYGIHVAQLAGIPQEVIRKSEIILKNLENNYGKQNIEIEKELNTNVKHKEEEQLLLLDPKTESALEKIRNYDINSTTPLDAVNFLAEIKKDLTN